MSWNITGAGTKKAVKKQIETYFDSLIKSSPGKTEYPSAKIALLTLVESVPDSPSMIQIEAWGSASTTPPGYFNTKIDIKLVSPTFEE